MKHHHDSTGSRHGLAASRPVSPLCQNSCCPDIDLFPNEIYDGGVAEAGEAPKESEGDDFEEWAPSAPSAPPTVSPMEREKHVLGGHVQYRSWCPHCLRIRGRANQHQRYADAQEKALPILHWDYCYLSTGDSEDDEAAAARSESPLLCM